MGIREKWRAGLLRAGWLSFLASRSHSGLHEEQGAGNEWTGCKHCVFALLSIAWCPSGICAEWHFDTLEFALVSGVIQQAGLRAALHCWLCRMGLIRLRREAGAWQECPLRACPASVCAGRRAEERPRHTAGRAASSKGASCCFLLNARRQKGCPASTGRTSGRELRPCHRSAGCLGAQALIERQADSSGRRLQRIDSAP